MRINIVNYFDDKEYWNSIDKEYIFWTPSTSNIFGYTLSNWYDVRFPHTCELLTHIKKTNLVTNIVLYVYTPHTRTTFHTDKVSFRYVYPIVSNEMCFNYEIKTNTSQFEMDTKLFDINTIDKLNNFNTEFVNSGNVTVNINGLGIVSVKKPSNLVSPVPVVSEPAVSPIHKFEFNLFFTSFIVASKRAFCTSDGKVWNTIVPCGANCSQVDS